MLFEICFGSRHFFTGLFGFFSVIVQETQQLLDKMNNLLIVQPNRSALDYKPTIYLISIWPSGFLLFNFRPKYRFEMATKSKNAMIKIIKFANFIFSIKFMRNKINLDSLLYLLGDKYFNIFFCYYVIEKRSCATRT